MPAAKNVKVNEGAKVERGPRGVEWGKKKREGGLNMLKYECVTIHPFR